MHSPQPTGQEGIKLSSYLSRQGWMAVLHRAVGEHKVVPQSLLEAFIQAVSEDKCLFPGPGDPRPAAVLGENGGRRWWS